MSTSSISKISRTVMKIRKPKSEVDCRITILRHAYKEYRRSIHFFNPDTADYQEILFDTFEMYEQIFGVGKDAIKTENAVDEDDNKQAIEAYRDSIEAWEEAVMDMNFFASNRDSGATIKNVWNLFVKAYEAFQLCNWN